MTHRIRADDAMLASGLASLCTFAFIMLITFGGVVCLICTLWISTVMVTLPIIIHNMRGSKRCVT